MAPWLEARRITEAEGGLLPHALCDTRLVGADPRTGSHPYPTSPREILAYPQINTMLRRKKDLIDAIQDNKGRSWMIPAPYIPEEAFERQGQGTRIGLFIDPDHVDETSKRFVVIVPKTAIVLPNFIQYCRGIGQVDGITRIPLEVGTEVASKLPPIQMRLIWRTYGAGVRIIVRGWTGGIWCFTHGIVADCGHDTPIWVTGMSSLRDGHEAAAQQTCIWGATGKRPLSALRN